MTSSKNGPDPAHADALRRMLLDPVWGASYEKACDSGLGALRAKAARFAAALAAREPGLDASVDAVRALLVSLAPEMHPDSPAVDEALAARDAWDSAWAGELMALAIREMADALPEDADPPILDAESARSTPPPTTRIGRGTAAPSPPGQRRPVPPAPRRRTARRRRIPAGTRIGRKTRSLVPWCT